MRCPDECCLCLCAPCAELDPTSNGCHCAEQCAKPKSCRHKQQSSPQTAPQHRPRALGGSCGQSAQIKTAMFPPAKGHRRVSAAFFRPWDRLHRENFLSHAAMYCIRTTADRAHKLPSMLGTGGFLSLSHALPHIAGTIFLPIHTIHNSFGLFLLSHYSTKRIRKSCISARFFLNLS